MSLCHFRLRGGSGGEEEDEEELPIKNPNHGLDAYAQLELRKLGLLPTIEYDSSDEIHYVPDAEDDSEAAAARRREELAEKLPMEPSAGLEEVSEWFALFNKSRSDRAEARARRCTGSTDEEAPVTAEDWAEVRHDVRFNGSTYRDPDIVRANETDHEFWRRYGEGFLTNKTLRGLHDLKLAVTCNDCEEIERLVSAWGVDPSGLCDEISREQPLHYSAYCGHIDATMLLLDLGADPNCRNAFNQTALHRAACGGFLQLCELLVERGADPFVSDAFGFTAPEWASYNGHNHTCQWFYGKFVHEQGAGFPRGSAPHYGLPEDAGREYFSPVVREVSRGCFCCVGFLAAVLDPLQSASICEMPRPFRAFPFEPPTPPRSRPPPVRLSPSCCLLTVPDAKTAV